MVQSLWSQHGALNHLLSLVYLSGEFSTLSYWFHQVPIAAGWTEATWDAKFAQHFYTWVTVLPYQPCHHQCLFQRCHHESIMFDFKPCHHSQSRLTYTLPPWVNQDQPFPCHHQSNTVDFYIATISQSGSTIALPPSVKHGWLALPPMSRTPCPVVPNVLDI